jgi:cytochrome c
MLSTDRCALRFGTGLVSGLDKPGKMCRIINLEKAMKRSLSVYLVLGMLVSNAAMANADLAKAKNCMACHAIANKVVGPAYKDVAAKYAGQKDAEDKLTQKVLKGGSGVWGAVPMPANAQVNEAEARTLVKWILSQK